MSTTGKHFPPQRNTTGADDRVRIRGRRTDRPHMHNDRPRMHTDRPAFAPGAGAPETSLPQSFDRPHGHVAAYAFGEPFSAVPEGLPRGHVVARAVREPLPAVAEGLPRGHVVAHATRKPLTQSLDGRPQGHVVGRTARHGTAR